MKYIRISTLSVSSHFRRSGKMFNCQIIIKHNRVPYPFLSLKPSASCTCVAFGSRVYAQDSRVSVSVFFNFKQASSFSGTLGLSVNYSIPLDYLEYMSSGFVSDIHRSYVLNST